MRRSPSRLLKAHPHLLIDNCASGGRRIDLETCSRAVHLWHSDNTCYMVDLRAETILHAAIKNQLMRAGLNRYMPFSTVGQMGATPYLFRSGFNAGIAFAEDCRPKDFPRDLLRQAMAEGKRLRKCKPRRKERIRRGHWFWLDGVPNVA